MAENLQTKNAIHRRPQHEITCPGRQQPGQPRVLRHQGADDQGRPIHQRHLRVPEHPAQPAFGPQAGRRRHCLGREGPHLPP